jgi:hypothetical protein
MLTPKQEIFCNGIVSGLSGTEAYKKAYNTNANNNTMRNEANKLLQRDDITERIKELRKPLQNHARNIALSEREKKKNIIWEEINNARSAGDHAAIARYMDILNKMDAEYINVTKDITEEKTNIETLDNDTLFKLVN